MSSRSLLGMPFLYDTGNWSVIAGKGNGYLGCQSELLYPTYIHVVESDISLVFIAR